jgi:hypothetical protein
MFLPKRRSTYGLTRCYIPDSDKDIALPFEGLTAVVMKVTVFWDRLCVPPKRRSTYGLRGAISQ